jgi:hypothetical protein
MEAREVHALVMMTNNTYTGNRAKKPEMATSRRCARKAFRRLSFDSFSHPAEFYAHSSDMAVLIKMHANNIRARQRATGLEPHDVDRTVSK